MARRTRGEIERSAKRVAREQMIPLHTLAAESGATVASLERWVKAGALGIFLDAYHDPVRGWLSSFPALTRFRASRDARIQSRKATSATAVTGGAS